MPGMRAKEPNKIKMSRRELERASLQEKEAKS